MGKYPWRSDLATDKGGVDRVIVGLATATCGVTFRIGRIAQGD